MYKRYFTLVLAGAAIALSSCSNNELLSEDSANAVKDNAIKFAYNLPSNSTRTVISSAKDFVPGCAMAVDGFQTTEAGEVDSLFKNEKVTLENDSVNWSYSPVRYWDIASTYVFYAMYPYSVDHSFKDTHYSISNYTNPTDKTKQQDIMIAEEKVAMPQNLVTFNFNHILSQVNFYLKASSEFNTTGIDSIVLKSFDVEGLKSTGSYAQTGWDETSKNVRGSWTVDASSTYEFPEVTSAPAVSTTAPLSPIETGLLMLPQELTGSKATVSYRIYYTGGATSSFSAQAYLKNALISKKAVDDGDESKYVAAWKPNYIYNYYLAVNPAKNPLSNDPIDTNGSTGGDAVPETGKTIVIDADGNYFVDTDGDGQGDIPIVWEDIDGDGREEGGIDADGDGHIDNVDNENLNPDGNPIVTDGDDTNNPDGKDVTLVDTDGDGICDTQLERDGEDGPYYPVPVTSMEIKFSATVEGWENEIDL